VLVRFLKSSPPLGKENSLFYSWEKGYAWGDVTVKESEAARGPATPPALRELNQAHMLQVIRREGPISRSDLVRRTGLAKPTVAAIVAGLLAAGVVQERGTRPAHGGSGRPAILVEFNPRHRLVAGCHIGNWTTTVMVADLDGKPVAVRTRPTHARSVDQVLDDLTGLIASALAGSGASQPCCAVGVSLPGLIDSTTGTCLHAFRFGWHGIPVADLLAQRLGVPVSVRNDAKAAIMAEAAEGAARSATDVVLVYEDEGIGTAIISGGMLLDGAKGIAGEIGHCHVPGATGQCNCGRTGCLETVSSAPALAAAVRELLGSQAGTLLPPHPALADMARLGRPDVDDLLARAGHEVGLATAWLINVINPQVAILGGGLPQAGQAFLDAFHAAVDAGAVPDAADCVTILASSIPDGAEVRGAVLAALELAARS
jgi:predicted NBD/HSP70 family sugar kinase